MTQNQNSIFQNATPIAERCIRSARAEQAQAAAQMFRAARNAIARLLARLTRSSVAPHEQASPTN